MYTPGTCLSSELFVPQLSMAEQFIFSEARGFL